MYQRELEREKRVANVHKIWTVNLDLLVYVAIFMFSVELVHVVPIIHLSSILSSSVS